MVRFRNGAPRSAAGSDHGTGCATRPARSAQRPRLRRAVQGPTGSRPRERTAPECRRRGMRAEANSASRQAAGSLRPATHRRPHVDVGMAKPHGERELSARGDTKHRRALGGSATPKRDCAQQHGRTLETASRSDLGPPSQHHEKSRLDGFGSADCLTFKDPWEPSPCNGSRISSHDLKIPGKVTGSLIVTLKAAKLPQVTPGRGRTLPLGRRFHLHQSFPRPLLR